jgi:hypothetical protein
MRLFLTLLLFDIVFRSFSVCFPWAEWGSELEIRLMPARLATRAELEERAARGEDASRLDDMEAAFASVARFFNPFPEQRTREKLTTNKARLKYTLTWLSSRWDLVENVLGYNEEWPMFSPNVSRVKHVARATLYYGDHSTCEVRIHGDPEDLTRYSHWNEEKVLDHELKVKEERPDECFGYCNLLAHRYPRNDSGAALVKIRLRMVTYYLPKPEEDARARLAEQSGPPEDQQGDDFYEYDVKTREGRSL